MNKQSNITSYNRSLHDFFEDCEEILYLTTDAMQKIRTFTGLIQGIGNHLFPETLEYLESEANRLLRVYQHIAKSIHNQCEEMRKQASELSLSQAFTCIERSREILRIHQTQLGVFVTCTDWQSPSFSHSMKSQAGVDEGKIIATINDYKRDQHLEAQVYEESFKKAYIDGLFLFPVHVYATSSGMAAFSTILSYLTFEKKLKGTILIGSSVYFECKTLITQIPNVTIIEVDEWDTENIIKCIDQYQPSVLFFDSIANMPSVAVPNLEVLCSHLVSHCKKDTILVVDNTCRSVHFQPIPRILGRFGKLSLIVFESLNKYHQFGMDRVTGGIIWCYGGDTGKISNYRVHTGTNIPDISAASLPTPNRRVLLKKLQRHGRNAIYLARLLQQSLIANPETHVTSVIYPQLANHPSFGWTKTQPFSGSFITLQFEKKYQTVASYKRFVHLVIKNAGIAQIPFVSGTSFGLHTTRIYLTAIRSKPTTPFIRISVGSEHFSAIESIAKILIQSIKQFR